MTREEVLEKIRKVIRDCVPEMVGEQLEEDTVMSKTDKQLKSILAPTRKR